MLGKKLFRDEGVPFLKGNIFDQSFLDMTHVSRSHERIQIKALNDPGPIDLRWTRTLTDLRGRVRFITCNKFFHLFDEAGQLDLARRLSSLLNNRSGSTIFGNHAGLEQKGVVKQ